MYSLDNSVDLWLSRWKALKKHIDQLHGLVTYTSAPRSPVFLATLEALGDFAEQHFNFIYDGLSQRGNAPFARDGSKYSDDFIMRYVIYRIAEDVNVLQKSITDRRTYAADALELADKLAYTALLPAIQMDIVPSKTQVITYFQKRASIRVIPYASVALVAVPLISLTQWKDLLATFHEVGHYVYWHGTSPVNNAPIRQRVQEVIAALYPDSAPPKWLQAWSEEIFADVYGALTGGAAIGLNFQHLANQMSPEEFRGDTEESDHHPIPYIRPGIYADVVEWSGSPTLAKTLREEWQRYIVQRNIERSITDLPARFSQTAVNLDKVKTELKTVVKAILEDCLGLNPDQLDETLHDFSAIPDNTAIGEIYNEHRLKLTVLANTPLDALTNLPLKRSWQEWAEAKMAAVPTQRAQTGGIPAEKWHRVVEADGWNTDGPGGSLLP